MENSNIPNENLEKTARRNTARAWSKFIIALLISYFVAPMLVTVCIMVGGSLMPRIPQLGTGLAELVAGRVAALAMIFLGGKKWLRFSGKGLGHAFRLSWPILAADVVLVIYTLIGLLRSGTVPAGIGSLLLGVFVLCIGVGVFEETVFRGVLLNGALAPLGKSRTWVLICVIAVSLWFGKVHVGNLDASDTTALILAILKILQAGFFGVIMSAIVLRTRQLGGAFLVHMLHDFLLMSASALQTSRSFTANYTDSSVGYTGFIAYGILLLISLPALIWAIRSILKNGDSDHGAFMPAEPETQAVA